MASKWFEMRRRSFILAMSLYPIAAHAASKVPVVATFSVLADMVHQVGGDAVAIRAFVQPDGDVHVYQPVPGDLRRLMNAAVLVENGLGLEGWLQRLAEAAKFSGVPVVASNGATLRTIRNERGLPVSDPHAWQDPRNGVVYVRNIAAGLTAASPTDAALFRGRADRFIADIQQTDTWIARQFNALPASSRRIITTHDAFGYFGARYGIEFLAAEGISTDSEPSAKGIAALVAQIRREKIRAIFLENMTDPRLAEMLAREAGVKLGGTVYSDALSPPGGPAATYLAMLRHNTTLFVSAMQSP